MPAEYMACVASEMKSGMEHKNAQKRCAIAYYKRHGKSVQEAEAHMKGKSESDIELDILKADGIPEIITMFAPISKVDEEKRMVFGYATTPSLDSQGETIDLQASFDAADEWSKWRNIKEMHRAETAVGIAPIIEKHTGVGVYIGAEIVDDQAWKKCLKGVYKGFSIGGKVKERDGKRITKYELREISLVDRPANPDTIFMVAKRDDDISSKGMSGGNSMEQTETPSVASAAQAETPSISKAEATPAQVTAATPEVVKSEAPKTEENATVSKADFDKISAELDTLRKQMELKKQEDEAKERLLKMIDELKPEIKKRFEEVKPELTNEENTKKTLSKMSMGELTAAMLKSLR